MTHINGICGHVLQCANAWQSQIDCASALANFGFSICRSRGPMVKHYCHGITIHSECLPPSHGKDVWKWLFHGNSVGP